MVLFDATIAVILVLALIADAIIGDPPALWARIPHPVVIIGQGIGFLDRRMNRSNDRKEGVAALCILLVLSGMAGVCLHLGARWLPGGLVAECAIVTILLAQRSLYDHVNAVALAFRDGGLEAARGAVSQIVGRDPSRLDEAGVSRAAIETTAENFSDGIIAPAFWYLLGGLPGILVYKAVNTADSMIGHRTPRHEQFGWAAARLDDLMNLVPARLSAVLIWVASLLPGFDRRGAARAIREDAAHHRSPNAGWPEAAMAGALGLALAGPRHYASGKVEDAWMNRSGDPDAGPAHIGQSLRLFWAACAIHGLVVGVIALAAFAG